MPYGRNYKDFEWLRFAWSFSLVSMASDVVIENLSMSKCCISYFVFLDILNSE
jgi:hypothetical protein